MSAYQSNMEEHHAPLPLLSWEYRHELGLFRALQLTFIGICFKPTETFHAMTKDSPVWGPLLYAVIVGLAARIIIAPFLFLLILALPGNKILHFMPIAVWLMTFPIVQCFNVVLVTGCSWIVLRKVLPLNNAFTTFLKIQCYLFGTFSFAFGISSFFEALSQLLQPSASFPQFMGLLVIWYIWVGTTAYHAVFNIHKAIAFGACFLPGIVIYGYYFKIDLAAWALSIRYFL